METVFFGGLALFTLLMIALAVATSVFWIVEIVDVARREFPDPNMKIVWLLVIVFSHVVGALVYYFVGKPSGRLPGSYVPPRPSAPPDQWPPPPTV